MAPMPLDYAPPPPSKWGPGLRRAAKVIVVLVILAGIAAALKVYLGPIWWRWQVQRAHDTCTTCIIPPSRIAFDFDGISYPVWLSAPATSADHATELLARDIAMDDLVFVHERRTKAGASKLVVLGLRRMFSFGDGSPFFCYNIFNHYTSGDPIGFRAADDVDVPRFGRSDFVRPVAKHRLTIFSGQPDPIDNSHFTIPYTLDGRAGIIDGYLEDNPKAGWMEYVRLTDRAPKTPPATVPEILPK